MKYNDRFAWMKLFLQGGCRQDGREPHVDGGALQADLAEHRFTLTEILVPGPPHFEEVVLLVGIDTRLPPRAKLRLQRATSFLCLPVLRKT